MNTHLTIEMDRGGSFLIGRRNAEGTLCFTMRYLSSMWSIPAALADYRRSFGVGAV